MREIPTETGGWVSLLSARVLPSCPGLVGIVTSRVRRFRGFAVSLETLISVLSGTVFAHIFPVSNENENERQTPRVRRFPLKFFRI